MLFGPFCVHQLFIKYNFLKWWLKMEAPDLQNEHKQKLQVS